MKTGSIFKGGAMKKNHRQPSLVNALIGLGVCAAVVLVFIFGAFFRETPGQVQAATELALHGVSRALLIYRSDCGSFPSESQGLAPLIQNPGCSGWKGPYLQEADLLDEWERPIVYHLIEGTPQLRSLGADGSEGGEAMNKDHVLVLPQD